jgi:arabinose-5-phosphate isomerase
MNDIIAIAREVLQTESRAVQALCDRLDSDFIQAVAALQQCKGRAVISGMGKSGLIGRKIAATFSSTGTPSMYLHPAEALHGDLGMLTAQDVLLSISNSGETDELLRMIPQVRALGVPHLSMVGKLQSTLARHADFVLDVSVEKEADPLQLAPTASTTAALAMGDALAVALMRQRNFQPEQFASLHPGGSLGRRLLTRVSQLMRTKNLPRLAPGAPIKEVIHQISSARLGLVVIEEEKQILGVITDGDVRRAMERAENEFFSLQASDLMTPDPIQISPHAKATEAEKLMQEKKITALLVSEKGQLKGIIQIYDLVL